VRSGANAVRVAGLIGLLAALINAVADVVFQGVADGSYSGDMQFMWEVPDARLRLGALVGALVIPFAIVGFWHIYQGIRRAGRFVAAAPVLIGGYAAAVGSGAHFALVHPALVGRAMAGAPPDAMPLLTELHASMVALNTQLFWVVAGFAVFSLWWMVLVFAGRTSYPRWAGVLNPLFLQIALGFILGMIPGIGSYLTPATSALSFAVFFVLSVRWLWNCDG
jgi:hypothetical protein